MAELTLSVQEAFERAELECEQGNLALGQQIYVKLARALPQNHPERTKAVERLQALQSKRLSSKQKQALIDLYTAGEVEQAFNKVKEFSNIYPDDWFVHDFMGGMLWQMNQPDEALKCYDKAISFQPNSPDCYSNRGLIQTDFALFSEALESFEQALELDNTHITAQVNRAFLLLLTSQFKRGWQDYEWRLKKTGAQRVSKHNSARWQGEDLKDKTIILLSEQGLGDDIQFCRYAKHLRNMGAKVTLECDPRLLSLMQLNPTLDTVVAKGKMLSKADYHCPLLSVPGLIGEDLTTPFETPYLFADKQRVSIWAKKFKNFKGLRIGATWQGSPTFKKDRLRSFPLEQFAPIAMIDGVLLISLQKGDKGVSQIKNFRKNYPIIDPEDMLKGDSDLMDAAAIMMNLDLVITSCTSIAHLGGALGVPTWIVLGKSADWRWFQGRDDSPWYPSVRLFRQTEYGDWNGVFQRVTASVHKAMAKQNT